MTEPRTCCVTVAIAADRKRAMIGRVTDDSQPVKRRRDRYVPGRLEPAEVDREDRAPGTSAMRKPGIAKPSMEMNCTVPSTPPPRRAARTPRTTERIARERVAPITIERVTARRLVRLTVTSWPVNHERPRSPVTARRSASPSTARGWAGRGRAPRPSAATVSAVAFWPRMRAGDVAAARDTGRGRRGTR